MSRREITLGSVSDVDYAQRVAMETRRRPGWLADVDEAPARSPRSAPTWAAPTRGAFRPRGRASFPY